MNTNSIGALCTAVMTIAWAGSVPALAANQLSAAEKAAGFKLLFDGASSSQWTINWPIEDSAMKSPNTGAMIYTREKYTDFEWRVDFKMNANGNSGFFIRTGSDWYCDGFEVAALDSRGGGDSDVRSNSANGDKLGPGILDFRTGKDFTVGSDAPVKRSGAIYEIYPTTKNGILIPNGGEYIDMMKPAMAWNTMVIWANGKKMETWLNGMKVTDFTIGSADWMTRFHRSKFGNGGNQCGDDYSTQPTGTLVVQDHGGGLVIWMRNNKIRTFTPGSKLTAPVAEPAGATFGTATKVKLDAGIIGASIRYTLDGSDPTETSTLYNDSTGLTVSKSGTVKFRSYRATFGASDVTSEAYVIQGTGIAAPSAQAVPQVGFIRSVSGLRIENLNGIPFSAELVTLDGARIWNGNVGGIAQEVSLAGMRSGIYLVRMQASGWSQTRRVAVP